MFRRTTSVAEQRPTEVARAVAELEPLDLRILRILDEAGAGQSLRNARRETDDLAIMLIASGKSTFVEFDRSLERLEAQSMITLHEEGFASLTEQARDRIKVTPLDPPVQQAETLSAPLSAAA
jgi:hypothetical protein